MNLGNEAQLVRQALGLVRDQLPDGWRVELLGFEPRESQFDAEARITGPDGKKARLFVEAKRTLTPRAVETLLPRIREAVGSSSHILLAAPFLSPAVRSRLSNEGISYVDLAGNIRVQLSSPGLFIDRIATDTNPNPSEPNRSLRGPKAARIIRTLIDFRRPPGVRELAARTGTDAGYVSKLLTFLDAEAVVTRGKSGRLSSVDWERLLRRWADDAPFSSRGVASTFLAARGLKQLTVQLGAMNKRYAITGSAAAARYAPIAPTRLLQIYVEEDLDEVANNLGLRPAEVGTNVVLVSPSDAFVFERSTSTDDGVFVAPSQAACDALTSPGRGPAEGDALLEWMKNHEEAWRG